MVWVAQADPVAALEGLLAAELRAAVPVVVGRPLPEVETCRIRRFAARLPRSEPLMVLVTSGSTGTGRAVVRTVASWWRSLPGMEALLGPLCPPGAPMWVPGGASSTLTLFGLWHALATGRPVIASGTWRETRSPSCGEGAVGVQCVPAVLDEVLAAREDGGLTALRRAVTAGVGLGPGLRARAESGGLSVAEYYGAAELSFVAADPDGQGLRPFPGVEVALRQQEIWVRSPYVARGYLDPAPGGPFVRDGDGWAGVGDRGRWDDRARLRVLGRGDTVAEVGGHTVLLGDVERALAEVPGVRELACLPQSHPRWGQCVVAVVRPAPDRPWAEVARALKTAARQRLVPAWRPVRYLARDQLPRTGGEKIARAALLEQLAAEGLLAGNEPHGDGRTLGA